MRPCGRTFGLENNCGKISAKEGISVRLSASIGGVTIAIAPARKSWLSSEGRIEASLVIGSLSYLEGDTYERWRRFFVAACRLYCLDLGAHFVCAAMRSHKGDQVDANDRVRI